METCGCKTGKFFSTVFWAIFVSFISNDGVSFNTAVLICSGKAVFSIAERLVFSLIQSSVICHWLFLISPLSTFGSAKERPADSVSGRLIALSVLLPVFVRVILIGTEPVAINFSGALIPIKITFLNTGKR